MIKAVLFDLDDTLLRTVEAKWAQHKAVASEVYGVSLEDSALRRHWGKPLSVLVGEFYQHADTVPNMLEANRLMAHKFPKGVFAGSVQVVNGLLDAGMLVGVVTSTIHAYAVEDLVMHKFPIERLFIVQGEDDHHACKPDPMVFEPALDALCKLDVAAEEVVYVGDSLLDYRAAVGAGIHFIGVTTGLMSEQAMREEGVASTAADLHECAELINAL